MWLHRVSIGREVELEQWLGRSEILGSGGEGTTVHDSPCFLIHTGVNIVWPPSPGGMNR